MEHFPWFASGLFMTGLALNMSVDQAKISDVTGLPATLARLIQAGEKNPDVKTLVRLLSPALQVVAVLVAAQRSMERDARHEEHMELTHNIHAALRGKNIM